MACAQTGSGKTCAFLTPIITQFLYQVGAGSVELAQGCPARPLALILAPTRELAVQIFQDSRRMCNRGQLKPRVIYGGADHMGQQSQLAQGCALLIATPGRLK